MSAVLPSPTAARAAPAAIPSGHALLWHEAWAELRFGMRSGVVALVFLGLTAYLVLMFSNAEMLRDMNAVDVPRNAAMLVYLITPGDSLFLFFAWAWVFAQPVVRERQAQLHELVLAAPVSLPALLAGRWLGAWAVALVLGASQMAGVILAPVLEPLGLVPAGSMGPTPWAALGWAWLIYIVPLSAGCGAMYLVAAMRTRSTAGPFAVAALLCVAWMLAMVIIKDGGISPFVGAIIDPSGFGEAERQVLDWTPQEKTSAFIAITPGFAINRVLWCLLPVLWLGWVLARARRETLALEAPAADARPPQAARAVQGPGLEAAPPLWAQRPAWWRVLCVETAWQLRQVLRTRMALVGAAMLVLTGVASGYVHVVAHADGPMVPTPELITPLLGKFMFLINIFIVAALGGSMARRDDRAGFGEMLDAAQAPLALRFAGKALALAVVAALLPQVMAVSAILLTALAAPHSLQLGWPLACMALVLAPAMLEMAALVLLVHALLRHAGMAHAASMLVAFVLMVNHEAKLVTYPLYEVGIPVHVHLSGITGWASWLGWLAAGDAYKLCRVVAIAALAGLLVVRGTDAGGATRLRAAMHRLRGGLGAALLASVAGLAGLGAMLHTQLVEEGGWKSLADERADAAAWERHWLARADARAPFAVQGGAVRIDVQPQARLVEAAWELQGVRAQAGWLHAELPQHFALQAVTVNGQPVQAQVEHDHLALPLSDCAATGCTVELRWQVAPRGWSAEGEPVWLHADALWLRAADVMPRLGLDGERALRAPTDRTAQGLPAAPPPLPDAAAVALHGVAPAGHWQWLVRVQGLPMLPGAQGSTQGVLDFAAVASPRLGMHAARDLVVAHGPAHADMARAVAADVQAMGACVQRRLGSAAAGTGVHTVVQAPRDMGRAQVAGGLLWLPESPGWDVADEGVGRHKRRADIARALAARAMADAAALRQGAGAAWLGEGLPGALGLLCMAEADGAAALQSVLNRASNEVTLALGASAEPVDALAQASTTGWARSYAPLAALYVAHQQSPAVLQALLAAVRAGQGVGDAAAHALGAEAAEHALGAPYASDTHRQADGTIAGQRWRWQGGGWQPAGAVQQGWAVGAADAKGGALVLDAWPSYERSLSDNAAP